MTAEPCIVNGKKVGAFEDDGWYHTYKNEDGFCTKHRGWGVQREAFDKAKEKHAVGQCTGICADYLPTGTKFYADMETWIKFGVFDTLRAQDGKQVFLHKNHFKAVKKE